MLGEDCLQLLNFVAQLLSLSNCCFQLRLKILIVLHESHCPVVIRRVLG
jgi:hypothetical protein